jgi:hypothetical protein
MANPLIFDAQRVWVNVRQATTEDLLNRVTVFRQGMEAEAIPIIESELWNRGVGAETIAAHEESLRGVVIMRGDGSAARCSFCHQPAVAHGWGWHKIREIVPLFPRFFYYCKDHQ